MQSGVIPGLRVLLPDHSLPQLAKLDDMGFSTGSNTLVVPRDHALSILAFLPQKTFEWPCFDYGQIKPEDTKPGYGPCAGLWVKRRWYGFRTTVEYRDFTSRQLSSLQERMFMLAAGDFVEVVDVSGSLTASTFTCPPEKYQRMFEGGAPVQCSLTGTNLDRLSKVQLIPSPNGQEPVVGSVSGVSSDKKSATVSFPACALNNLPTGTYALESLSGNLNGTAAPSLTIKVPGLRPSYPKPDGKTTVDLSSISSEEWGSIKQLTANVSGTAKSISPPQDKKLVFDVVPAEGAEWTLLAGYGEDRSGKSCLDPKELNSN